MSQLNKILLALGITILLSLIIIGGYNWWHSKNSSTKSTPTKESSAPSSRNDPNGPYYHQVYTATSKDGLSWNKTEKMIFDHASVPGAVMKEGKIYLYFVDASGNNDQLSVAVSTDNGNTFDTQQEVKIKDVKKWDAVDPHPELVNGKIRLYYFGNFSTMAKPDSKTTATMYSAESSDGMNFDNAKEAYKSDDSQQIITDPDVIKTSTDWRMFVSKGKNMDLLVSKDDGITFTKEKNFTWNKGSVSDTFNFNNTFRTYYCGEKGIQSATGINKGSLTTESGTRIAADDNMIVCDPSVIQLPDNTYLMFYKQQKMSTSQGGQSGPGSTTPGQTPGQQQGQNSNQTPPTQ